MGPSTSRRRALELTGLTLAAALPGCASVADQVSPGSDADNPDVNSSATGPDRTDNSSTDESASDAALEVGPPNVSFANVPLPNDPGAHPYARMGTGADVTATVFGNWKCPYTQAMVVDYLPSIVSSFVRPGDLDLEFRFLAYRSGEPFLGADAPRATRAGLAVWDEAPATYWSYFSYVFGNQPSSDERWATPSALGKLADKAGADIALDDHLDGNDARVDRTVAAARKQAVYSVPRLAVDGDVFAPTIEPAATTNALASATKNGKQR